MFSPERKETFWSGDQKFSFGYVCLKSLLNFLVEISSRQFVTWVTYTENKTEEGKSMYNSMENKWHMGFPGGASGKEPSSQSRRHTRCRFNPPGDEHGNPLQYSCLENPLDRGAPWAGYSPQCCKEMDMTEVT